MYNRSNFTMWYDFCHSRLITYNKNEIFFSSIPAYLFVMIPFTSSDSVYDSYQCIIITYLSL